jgi:hypothetical protein
MNRIVLALSLAVLLAACGKHHGDGTDMAASSPMPAMTSTMAMAAASPAPSAVMTVGTAAPGASVAGTPASMGRATPMPQTTRTWTVKDNGKRCFAAPCPSWTATDAAGSSTDVTDIDVSGLGLSPKDAAAAKEKLYKGGKVEGTIKTVPKAGPAGDGTVLVVTRIL